VDVSAVFFIIGAEHLTKRWLFVQEYEQRYRQNDRARHCDCGEVCPSEDYPQTDPAGEEARVHGISQIAIEPDHNQPGGRSDGRRGSVSCPSEVPNASQGNREPEYRGYGRNPAPAHYARRVDVKTQPGRQQPEPQGKKAEPTAKEAMAAGQCAPGTGGPAVPVCSSAMNASTKIEVCAESSTSATKKALTRQMTGKLRSGSLRMGAGSQ
jgi:hypothetical protein